MSIGDIIRTEDEALALLAKLQRVEPVGLFARNLADCLRLQAVDQGLLTPAFAVLLDNLPMLAQADLRGLCRLCAVSLEDLKAMLRQLRSFNPKPGATFDGVPTPQRAPDLIVTLAPEARRVDLNRSTLPTGWVKDGESLPPAPRSPVLPRECRQSHRAGPFLGQGPVAWRQGAGHPPTGPA